MRLSPALAALAAATGLVLAAAAPASADLVADPIEEWTDAAAFSMEPIGTYETGIFAEGASEIVAYHAASHRLFVVNAVAGLVEALDLADPTSPVKIFEVDTSSVDPDGVANSVAVRADGLAAIALETDPKTDDGHVVFFDANGSGAVLGAVQVGALPDMLTFTPDGAHVLVANEAEPADDYSSDPAGSVSVIAVPAGIAAPVQADVATAGFTAFDAAPPAGVRVFGEPGVTTLLSQSVEPEYITVASDSGTAWVTLQEANAIAELDVASATISAIHPLGFKDWSASALDPSNNDTIGISPFPVLGMYQPDAIGSVGGYLVTANEGDVREWGDYSEETSIEDETLCDPAAQALNTDDGFGPLKITNTLGFDDVNGCFEQVYAFGARSFSVWSPDGELVFDSGDAFERLTARVLPDDFNSNHESSNFDNRSDDKGPEPEGLAIGAVDGVPYVFVGFERVGGVAVYRMTDPTAPEYVGYLNNRDFSVDAEDDGVAGAGDLGPEGLAFISAADSPTGVPLLVVGNEVSGSTTVYAIRTPMPEPVLAMTGGDGGAIAAGAALALLVGGLVLHRRRRAVAR